MSAARVLITLVAASVLVHAQPSRPADLVLANGIVITMDGSRRVLNPGSVAMTGTTIVGVGAPEAIAAQFQARDTIDARAA